MSNRISHSIHTLCVCSMYISIIHSPPSSPRCAIIFGWKKCLCFHLWFGPIANVVNAFHHLCMGNNRAKKCQPNPLELHLLLVIADTVLIDQIQSTVVEFVTLPRMGCSEFGAPLQIIFRMLFVIMTNVPEIGFTSWHLCKTQINMYVACVTHHTIAIVFPSIRPRSDGHISVASASINSIYLMWNGRRTHTRRCQC